MSLEFRPAGVACNIRCHYCYEESTREHGETVRYDKAKVWQALSETKEAWSLFGGEPLLIPLTDLEELLELGYRMHGRTAIQTNGNLITSKHIELFTTYRTGVGISVDGPDELNDIRWAGTLEATRKLTARTHWAIQTLAEKARNGTSYLMPSIIATLHTGNASPDRADRFIEWLYELDAMGITFVNLHVMEMDFKAQNWALDTDAQLAFLKRLWDLVPTFKNLKFQKFQEILDLLRGHEDKAMCVWHACDPWNTAAVQGLEGNGAPSHCTRTNKDGKAWLPASGAGIHTTHAIGGFPGQRFHERQLSLYVTPQEHGGCKDCRFWMMCLGQCPGTGESSPTYAEGDWRLRSSYCELWKGLFSEGEKRLLAVGEQPVSLYVNRKALEDRMYSFWAQGKEVRMSGVIAEAKGELPKWFDANGHGDHTDAAPQNRPHGDIPHGDHSDASGSL